MPPVPPPRPANTTHAPPVLPQWIYISGSDMMRFSRSLGHCRHNAMRIRVQFAVVVIMEGTQLTLCTLDWGGGGLEQWGLEVREGSTKSNGSGQLVWPRWWNVSGLDHQGLVLNVELVNEKIIILMMEIHSEHHLLIVNNRLCIQENQFLLLFS